MLTVNDFQVTYTPGQGYSAKLKNGEAPNVSILWGEEVRGMLETAYAGQQAAIQNTAAVDRAQLTDEDLADLSERFDPHNMTQDQYDEFLETLVDKKVLTRQEMQYAGYKGMVPALSFDRLTDCTGMSMEQIRGMKSGLSLFGIGGMDGDVLSWVNVMDLRTSGGKENNNMYHAMRNVLNSMAAFAK